MNVSKKPSPERFIYVQVQKYELNQTVIAQPTSKYT